MSSYTATIVWQRTAGEVFTDRRYNRAHVWRFDGGCEVPASPSPHIVKAPMSDEASVDPEEAFVASLSSCHMLFFLDYTCRAGFVVDRYTDEAEGVLDKGADGRMAMTRVTLRPRTVYGGPAPSREQEEALHHKAHDACFIANSVKTDIAVELG